MVRIKWLKSAQTDLKEIHDYISLDSKRYAKLQVERIYQKIQILQLQPLIGKQVKEIKNTTIRELVEGNYRIIYKIISYNVIHILMIHHGARDLSKRI